LIVMGIGLKSRKKGERGGIWKLPLKKKRGNHAVGGII